jgi:sigma-E factor negative regulatory protein RseB
MFTQIEYPAVIDDSALRSTIDARKFVWIRHETPGGASAAADGNWIAEHLPPGFRQVVSEQQQVQGVPEPIEHLMFSDGMTSVSAFMAPSGAPQAFKGISRMGAVNAYGKMTGQYHITVVGEVPRETVEFIADNLRHQTQVLPASAALTATPVAAPDR